MKLISICIPCFNESQNIRAAYERVKRVAECIEGCDYEIVFEDNASTDDSEAILRDIVANDKRVRAIFNSRNFGIGRSGTNCLASARGAAAVLIPCDMQDPPELIPEMISAWQRGAKVVWGQKRGSSENGLMYGIRSAYYRVFIDVLGVRAPPQVDGFGVYDRVVLDDLKKYCDAGRGVKTLVGEAGYPLVLIPYHQEERQSGSSSYNLRKYINQAVNNVVVNTEKPLDVMFTASTVVMFLSCGALMAYLLTCLTMKINLSVECILLFFLLVLVALQMFIVSLLGKYVGRIKERVDGYPFVFVKEEIGKVPDCDTEKQ